MGVLIKSNSNRPIKLVHSGDEINSAYARINFKSYPDGITMEIELNIFLTKEDYNKGNIIYTDIPDGNFFIQIDTISEVQSLDYAHVYVIQYLENMGYECKMI